MIFDVPAVCLMCAYNVPVVCSYLGVRTILKYTITVRTQIWELKKNQVVHFGIFFFVVNDRATAVSDFGILFFANRQFFLKFSKNCKKINFEAYFMHISL